MASFISGLNKSKKHKQLKDVTGKQMGVIEGSEESLPENTKEDNKQLQQKVVRNEKLIQQLKKEQLEHEHISNRKEEVKARNRELVAEQKLLTSTGKELELESEKQFGAAIKRAVDRIAEIEKEMQDLKLESSQFEIETRSFADDDIVGKQYFTMDKAMMERMVEEAKKELENMTGKLEQLKAARAKRSRIYSSVDELMAERNMIIDLAMARGQTLQAKEEDNAKIKKVVNELQQTAADLQKK